MELEKINQQNILEIASRRFKTIIAEANQEITLKLPPNPGVEGIIILLQPSLPSIR